ncbi:MAG: DUF2130 domain-containing protein [Candidatus Kapabacteria bacterium]|nr:DUF2130 domain-containing protein [Candidatus Kapabacteria bacterium]
MSDEIKNTIKCPNCGTVIEVTKVLWHEIEEKVSDDYRKKYFAAIEKERKKVEEEQKQKYEQTLAELKKTLNSKDEEIAKANKKAEELLKKEAELIEKENLINITIQKRLEEEKSKIAEYEQQKNKFIVENLQKELEEQAKKLEEAQKIELEARRKQKELEDKEKNLELVVEQKLAEEMKKRALEIEERKNHEMSLKIRQYEEREASLKRTIEELKQKSEQGSIQLQGEAQEIELEELLKRKFIFDIIEPVPKGMRGADCIQTIRNDIGQECGKIIWESKRTKDWQNNWIDKLKNDKNESNADVAVIVTQAMPKEIKNFGFLDGVWITSFNYVPELAFVLRESIIQFNMIKLSQAGKDQKMELMYDYLTGTEFKNKIQSIVEAFVSMKSELEKEKAAMAKIWSKRERQIEIVRDNTIKIYGSLQAIIGKQLPEINYLELNPVNENNDF